jgi:hypothetical protein
MARQCYGNASDCWLLRLAGRTKKLMAKSRLLRELMHLPTSIIEAPPVPPPLFYGLRSRSTASSCDISGDNIASMENYKLLDSVEKQ